MHAARCLQIYLGTLSKSLDHGRGLSHRCIFEGAEGLVDPIVHAATSRGRQIDYQAVPSRLATFWDHAYQAYINVAC